MVKISSILLAVTALIGSASAVSGNGRSTRYQPPPFFWAFCPVALCEQLQAKNYHRYWDCCKPSCGWPGKAAVGKSAQTCSAGNHPLNDANLKSGCDGGPSYACANNQPWAVNSKLSYGFAATAINGGSESTWCCACYKLTFTSGPVVGQEMIVQSINTGGDLSSNHFDLLIPGGGVGLFNGCTSQYGGNFPGARYGGVSSRAECDKLPQAIIAGCRWRFDWFKNADNPTFSFAQVQCPRGLLAVSGCKRDDDGLFPPA
ncbi:K-family cellulase [Beauveria bassiana ARSEF 2860]|uniref:cellulase n=1 Tax=Beauveria bassiana (strain ARSEF 2860) TaxID=655819 RepID=J4UWR7_BEAB2|nr:K-family cellulase [Beauveria bassiana ARSEF 2860]EJP70787.1 K-family cellulase [Beauveria bassiana ARSEF 2860]